MQDLKQAVIELDTKRTMTLITRIAERDAILGAALRSIADNLEYDKLLALLETRPKRVDPD